MELIECSYAPNHLIQNMNMKVFCTEFPSLSFCLCDGNVSRRKLLGHSFNFGKALHQSVWRKLSLLYYLCLSLIDTLFTLQDKSKRSDFELQANESQKPHCLRQSWCEYTGQTQAKCYNWNSLLEQKSLMSVSCQKLLIPAIVYIVWTFYMNGKIEII